MSEPTIVQSLQILTQWPLEKLLSLLQTNDDEVISRDLKRILGVNDKVVITDIRSQRLDARKFQPLMRESELKDVTHQTFFRVYAWVKDLIDRENDYCKVGWVMREGVTHCMVCSAPFLTQSAEVSMKDDGWRTVSRHCVACGNLVCSNCCSQRATIDIFSGYESLPVCDICSYGQSPVMCVPNEKEGSSILYDNRSPVATRTTPQVPVRSSSPSAALPLHTVSPLSFSMEKKYDLSALIRMKELIQLKDYGSYEFIPVRPKLYLRIAYKVKVPIMNRHSSKVKFTTTESFIYANICTSSKIPWIEGFLSSTPSDGDYTTLLRQGIACPKVHCLVFSPLEAETSDGPVIDVAVNDQLLLQSESNSIHLEDLQNQIVAGISLLFPEKDLLNCSITNSDTPFTVPNVLSSKSSRTSVAKRSIGVSIPSQKAMILYRYCYLQTTDLLLHSKSLYGNAFMGKSSFSNASLPRWTRREKQQIESEFVCFLDNLLQSREIIRRQLNQQQVQDITISPLVRDRTSSKESISSSESSIIESPLAINTSRLSVLSRALSTTTIQSTPLPFIHQKDVALSLSELPLAVKNRDLKKTKSWPISSLFRPLKQSTGMILPERIKVKRIITEGSFTARNEGKEMITPSALEILPSLHLDPSTEDELKALAKEKPEILLGWQVKVLNKNGSVKGIYVVTGETSSFIYGHLFRLSNLEERNDKWVKLKLLPEDRGRAFQPLRKVLVDL